jgi:hypothetical protein
LNEHLAAELKKIHGSINTGKDKPQHDSDDEEKWNNKYLKYKQKYLSLKQLN